MTDDLYERYKEALRTGHVAVLRGSLGEAIAGYRIAADIAPSRALPHTSLGGVYLRLGHLEDALSEYASAVARAPHDEGALLGQAEALTTAGMRSDAAAALDHVAEIQEASGRLPEAAGTLRRAMELEESVERTRRQRSLLHEIRLTAGDHAAEQLLARALRLRDEAAPEPQATPLMARLAPLGRVGPGSLGTPRKLEPLDLEAEVEPEPAAAAKYRLEPEPEPEPEPVVARAEPEVVPEPEPVVARAEPEAVPEPEPVVARAEPEAVPEPEPVVARVAEAVPEPEPIVEPVVRRGFPELAEPPLVGVMAGARGAGPLDLASAQGIGESQHQPSGDELLAAAEAADQAGDTTALRSLLIWTSRAYAREGRFEAGLDAAHRLLMRYPADVDAHLVLVELYVAHSWDGLAKDKLKLLDRLAELDGDQATHERLCAAASRAFPDDPSLARICAQVN